MKKFLVGLMAIPLAGCEFAKASLDTAKDGLSAPPEAVKDAWELTLQYLVTLVMDFLGGLLGPAVDFLRGALGI